MLKEEYPTPSKLYSKIYSVFCKTFRTNSTTKASGRKSRIVPCTEDHLPEHIDFTKSKFIYLHGYLVILHCIEDEILKYYLLLDLEEFLRKHVQFYWMKVLCESRDMYLKYLLDQEVLGRRDFFGNYCCRKNLLTCWYSIKFRFKTRICPKRVQRHRGYRDKGNLPKLDEKVRREELQKDVWMLEEQLEEERIYLQQEEEIQLLRNYLQGNGFLLESHKIKFRFIRKDENYEERNDS